MNIIKKPIWKFSTKAETISVSMTAKNKHFQKYLLQETTRGLSAERVGAILFPLASLPFKVHQLNKVVGRGLSKKIKDASNLNYNLPDSNAIGNLSSRTGVTDNQDPPPATNPGDLADLNPGTLKGKGQYCSDIGEEQGSLFRNAVKKPYFVDNTMLIKYMDILDASNCNIICAPKGSGKSFNLDMINDYYGIHQSTPSRRIDVALNPNKALFENTLISKETELFNKHFGRSPVIYLKFKRAEGSSVKECEERLGDEAFAAISRYKYLLGDPNLFQWFRDLLNITKADVRRMPDIHLYKLCRNLTQYYGEVCMILIDDFDLPIRSMIQNSRNNKEKKAVMRNYGEFFSRLLKGNHYAKLKLLTGISRMDNSDISSSWSNITEHKVTTGCFDEFYGFDETKMHNLLSRDFIKDYGLEDKFKEEYNGYKVPTRCPTQNKGKGHIDIYNARSVVGACQAVYEYYLMGKKALNAGELDEVFKRYWFDSPATHYATSIFKPLSFHIILQKLLNNKPVYCDLGALYDNFTISETLIRIYDFVYRGTTSAQTYGVYKSEDIILSFLVSAGYLTFERVKVVPISGEERETTECEIIAPHFVNKEKRTHRISIPNNEVRKSLEKVNEVIISEIYKSSALYIDSAIQPMNMLLNETETTIEPYIREVLTTLRNYMGNRHKVLSTKLETSHDSFFFNEKTLLHFFESIVPNEKAFFQQRHDSFYSSGSGLVLLSNTNKRAIILELDIKRDNVEIAYKKTERYCCEAKKGFKDLDEVLRIGINCYCPPPGPNNNGTKKDKIQYMYSLHRYKQAQPDRTGEEPTEQGTKYEVGDAVVKPVKKEITHQEADKASNQKLN